MCSVPISSYYSQTPASGSFSLTQQTPIILRCQAKTTGPIRRYRCLTALFMLLFGKAICVRDGNRKLVLNKSDLTHAVFSNKSDLKKIEWIVKKNLNEYLFNPSTSKPLTIQEISLRVHNLRHHVPKSQTRKFNQSTLIHGLRAVAMVPPIRQDDTLNLLKALKKGDILFYNTYKAYNSFDRMILCVQYIWRLFTKGSNASTYYATHTALYIGDGKLAEASDSSSGKCVRILKLDDIRCALEAGHKEQYRVFRAKGTLSEESGIEASEAAKRYADEVKSTLPGQKPTDQSLKPTKLGYTLEKAARALFHNSSFGKKAKKRVLKAAIMNHLGLEIPLRKRGTRDFFCSYFVGWLIHAGQSPHIISELVKKGLQIPDFSESKRALEDSISFKRPIIRPDGISDKEYQKITFNFDKAYRKEISQKSKALMKQISDWSKENANKFSKELDELTHLQLDVKNTLPQRFLGYLLQNPNRFEEVCHILPPQAATCA